MRGAGDDDGAVVTAKLAAPQQVGNLAVVGGGDGQRGVDVVAATSVCRWWSVFGGPSGRGVLSKSTKAHVCRFVHSFASNAEHDTFYGPAVCGSIDGGGGELTMEFCCIDPAKSHTRSYLVIGIALEVQSKYG